MVLPDVARVVDRSVVPLFMADDHGLPDRTGSCVLVHLLGRHFLITAAHILKNKNDRILHIGQPGGNLIGLSHGRGFFTVDNNEDLDIGVVPLEAADVSLLSALQFVPESALDLGPYQHQSTARDYVVYGCSESNSQWRIDPARRRNIQQKTFTFFTGMASYSDVVRSGFDSEAHLILEFDRKNVTVNGKRHTPPDPRGISGGAAFQIVSGRLKLSGIMTDVLKTPRVMVATRMSEVVAFARYVVESERL